MVKDKFADRLHRNTSFWIVSIILVSAIIYLDFIDYLDPCLMMYGSTAAISSICALLFADWWHKKGSASSIYKWLTVLLFALALNDWLQFATRYVYVTEPGKYAAWLEAVWWEYRSVPKLLALIYLLSFALWQRYGSASVYHDVTIRQDMANGFERLEARIVAGELRFLEHTKEGAVLISKMIIQTETSKED